MSIYRNELRINYLAKLFQNFASPWIWVCISEWKRASDYNIGKCI